MTPSCHGAFVTASSNPTSKPEPADSQGSREHRRAAISFMLDAFDAGDDAGIEQTALSRAALFQAIMRMVEELGEEGTAQFLRASAEGVRSGYYSRADTVN